ncbi:MAG: hypothetical protein S4CHLAM6_00780 [Chlamydiae bacterium]|nr:hypothetical protein [Chlamydiota bacterium]
MATGAKTKYSDIHAQFKAEFRGSQEPQRDTPVAIAGRTYQILSKAGQKPAKNYAESKLQEQAAKIQTLFKQFGPTKKGMDPRISADTLKGLTQAFSVIGISLEKSTGAIQKLDLSDPFSKAEKAFTASESFGDIAEITQDDGTPEGFKHAAIKTELRSEIAKTAVLIEEFFSTLDDKAIQYETAAVLDNVLKEMGLQLKKVNLPSIDKASSIEPPTLEETQEIPLNAPYFQLRDMADELMKKDEFCLLNTNAIDEIVRPITRALAYCSDKDTGKFSISKIDDSALEVTSDVKEYVRRAAAGKTKKEEVTEQLAKDVIMLKEYAEVFSYPIGLIQELALGYTQILERSKDDAEGMARFYVDEQRYYEVNLKSCLTELTAIIQGQLENIFKSYTDPSTQIFNFEKFFDENSREKNEILHDLMTFLKNKLSHYGIDPTQEELLKQCQLPFRKSTLLAEMEDRARLT